MKKNNKNIIKSQKEKLAEILFITSYPPRVCGIATFSQDLIKALNIKFSNSLSVRVCALESGDTNFNYPDEVKYVLKTAIAARYSKLARDINNDDHIKLVLIEHEFGFFRSQPHSFLQFLSMISKPVIIAFHTVLPNPDIQLKLRILKISEICKSIIVMTNNSAEILRSTYGVPGHMITVIPHGTHLVPHLGKEFLKEKYGLTGRKVISTFGLLSSGKSIETTLKALPAIIKNSPEVIFLIIGKTHPEVIKSEGEKYRKSLVRKVKYYALQDHVIFINSFLALPELLEYLQLTDIYLFTTNDPYQAVSGTFAYAMSCGCPIISTPIPHAREVLSEDNGIIFDFRNSGQLAEGVIRLLNDEQLRRNFSSNTLQKIVSTAWENSAVAHVILFEKISEGAISIQYNLPEINLNHLLKMTDNIGMIQFSKINQPDIDSGYTLDDNARALVAMCMYYRMTGDDKSIQVIRKYLSFIKGCQQPDGDFLNYVDRENHFTDQNKIVNLDDSNGRAIWALGYLISARELLPSDIISEAETIIKNSVNHGGTMLSTRAMAFAIKGLYYYSTVLESDEYLSLIKTFANRLVQMYRHVANDQWQWFESYLTYANSILPEAMLYTWLLTGDEVYKDIAISSFNFLLSRTFNENGIEVISNKNWLQMGQEAGPSGEQPIDVAYTLMTLSRFYDVLRDEGYLKKMVIAFDWFLGNNRLHQIIYNPCTGGCYDGLEDTHINLNQGAESTVSYLMARFTIEKYKRPDRTQHLHLMKRIENTLRKEVAMIELAITASPELPPYHFISDLSGTTKRKPNHRRMSE